MLKKILLIYCQLMLVYGCSWGQQIFDIEISYPWSAQTPQQSVLDAHQLPDSSYIFLMNSLVYPNNYDFVIFKTDNAGNLIWHKRYDFTARDYISKAAYDTASNTFYSIAIIKEDSLFYDVPLFIQFDTAGNILNTKKIILPFEINFMGTESLIINNNLYSIATMYDDTLGAFTGLFFKADLNLNVQYVKEYFGGIRLWFETIKTFSNGDMLINGEQAEGVDVQVDFQPDRFLMRIDTTGNIIWKKSYYSHVNDSINQNYDGPFDFMIDGDSIIATGDQIAGGGRATILFVDSAGNQTNAYKYLNSVPYDKIIRVKEDYFVDGSNLIRFDSAFNQISRTSSQFFSPAYLFNTIDNGVLMTGSGAYTMVNLESGEAIKIDSLFNWSCTTLTFPTFQKVNFQYFERIPNITFVDINYTNVLSPLYTTESIVDFAINCQTSTALETEIENTAKLFPNPFSDKLHLEVSKNSTINIFDFTGRKIKTVTLQAGENTLYTNELKSGIYLLKLENSAHTFKLIKL